MISVIETLKEKGLVDTAAKNIQMWFEGDMYAEYHDELKQLVDTGDIDALNMAFYQTIPFGTGGRRGEMGVGTNRINNITIGASAQGYVNFLVEKHGADIVRERGFVVTYDVRHNSEQFAKITASVFAANGIPVYFFDGPRSTPQVSFSVRYFNAVGGAMISASHNPPNHNGIKIYNDVGGQEVPPFDKQIIDKVDGVTEIQRMDFDAAVAEGMVRIQSADMDHAYQDAVGQLSLGNYRDISILFTPLHGVSTTSFLPVLKRVGFEQIHVLESQVSHDPDFSGVTKQTPNPEVPESLDKAMREAKSINADIVLASDPDADRIGVVSKKSIDSDEQVFLNGNQIGVLLFDYITQERDVTNGAFIKTVVTTELLTRIAEAYEMKILADLPVGFKYIAYAVDNSLDGKEFTFGAEESHGYLYGDYARDKDGAIAALLISEYAAKLKQEGKTLYEQLVAVQKKYGYYRELLQSVYYQGMDGMNHIQSIMKELRTNPPKEIAGYPVREILDQQQKVYLNGQSGEKLRDYAGFPDNALMFELEVGRAIRLIVRPSGTEPKIKYYAAAGMNGGASLEETKEKVDAIAHRIIEDIVRITDTIAPGGDKYQLLG